MHYCPSCGFSCTCNGDTWPYDTGEEFAEDCECPCFSWDDDDDDTPDDEDTGDEQEQA